MDSGDSKGGCPCGPSKWARHSPTHHPRSKTQDGRDGVTALPFSPIEQMKMQRQTSHSNRPIFRVPAGRGGKATCKLSLNSAHGPHTHAHATPTPPQLPREEYWNDGFQAPQDPQGQRTEPTRMSPPPLSAPSYLSQSSCDKCTRPQLTESPISLCELSPPPTVTTLDWTEGPSTHHTEHM